MANQINGSENASKTANTKSRHGAKTDIGDTLRVGIGAVSDRIASVSSDWGTRMMSGAQEVPRMSRDMINRVDRSARANPWMHIGLVGAGFFALGFVLGRGAFSGSEDVDA